MAEGLNRFAEQMISFRSIVLAAAFLATTAVVAHADKRVALVIGNSAYKNVNRLKNPANDAAVVAMLKTAGFDAVDLRQDLNVVEMRRALREFGNKTRDADVLATPSNRSPSVGLAAPPNQRACQPCTGFSRSGPRFTRVSADNPVSAASRWGSALDNSRWADAGTKKGITSWSV
jgi:hypothetical protein